MTSMERKIEAVNAYLIKNSKGEEGRGARGGEGVKTKTKGWEGVRKRERQLELELENLNTQG